MLRVSGLKIAKLLFQDAPSNCLGLGHFPRIQNDIGDTTVCGPQIEGKDKLAFGAVIRRAVGGHFEEYKDKA